LTPRAARDSGPAISCETMADVLAALADLELRCAIHQATEGFYADNREGRRAIWHCTRSKRPSGRSGRIASPCAAAQPWRDCGASCEGAPIPRRWLSLSRKVWSPACDAAPAVGVRDDSRRPRLSRVEAGSLKCGSAGPAQCRWPPVCRSSAQEDHFPDRSSIFGNVLKVMSCRPDGAWYGRTEQIPALKEMQRDCGRLFFADHRDGGHQVPTPSLQTSG
jgi:hypothetical protein